MTTVTTIGYQAATVGSFLEAVREGGVGLMVDVRAVASSRRPGFSKSRLAANLGEAGVGYVHLRALGTPAEGRAAARAGRHARMREVYRSHLATAAAQAELEALAELVRTGPRVCLLCFESDPAHCHRSLVAAALGALVKIRIVHLKPVDTT
ncbi:MAG: DUF488 domain-containing protein [Gemmatimonadales bacterium]